MRMCLTTSVNYGDILYYTLPQMLCNFGRVLVVTTPDDRETRDVAKHFGSDLFITDDFYYGDSPFNKARATRRGINYCRLAANDRLALVDADIYLPRYAWRHMRRLPRDTIYGCHRRMCKSPGRWDRFLSDGNMKRFPLQKGKRLGKVLGYFQFFSMWKFQQIYPEGYPVLDECKTAGKIDIVFSSEWKDHGWLDFQAIHLGPEATNWSGRVSERFR